MPIGEMYRGENSGGTQVAENKARNTWKVVIDSFLRLCLKQVVLVVKNPSAVQETQVQSLGQEDPLEKEMTTHSSSLAWKIPWTEEPGRLQSMGSQRVK